MAEFLNDSIEGTKELLKQIELLKKELKEIAKVAAEATKNINTDKAKSEEIQKITKAQQTLIATQKELTKIEKQEADVVAKINALRNGEQDELLKLKAVQQDLLKQKKIEAKQEAGLIGAYKKKSDALRKLKNEFKDATLAGTKSRKELDKMRKTIIDLDDELVELDNSVNDSFRNIGKYEKAVERLEKDLVKLAAASAGVAAGFSAAKGSLEANEEGSEELREATGKLDAALSVTKNTIATAALDLWNFGDAVISGEKSITDIGSAFDKTGEKLNTFGKDLKTAISASEDATKAEIELEKTSRALREEVERLNGEIDEQGAIAGDTTKGMDSIAEANEKALVAEQKRNAILVGLAQSERNILRDRIAALGDGANKLALQNELSEKEIELIGLRNDLRTSTIELEKELALNERDRFEKALDYALDLFDTQKTLNERQIADENKTFQERFKLLDRTRQLSNEAFEEQIRLAEKQTGEQLKLNELVAIDDQKVIYDRINALTQDEIVQQRILDIIRDRKTAILDLADAERELEEAQFEAAQESIEAWEEFTQYRLDRAAEIAEGIDEIEEKQIAATKNRFDVQIRDLEEGTAERLRLEQEKEDAITDIQNDAIEKRKEAQKKADEEALERLEQQRQEALDFAKQLTGELGNELTKRNQDKIDSLDSEIEAQQTTLEKQEELEQKGLDNTAAFERQRANEIALARKEALEKQQRQEEAIKLAEAFISSFEARVSEDPNTAIQLATKDVFLARGIAKTLAAGFAYDGTEDTGSGAGLDEKNGKLWMIHPNERIMSKAQNSLVGDLSNDELANLAYNYRMGIPIEKEKAIAINSDNLGVINSIKSLENTLKSKPTQQIDIDKLGNIIEIVENKGFKRITKLKTRSRL